MSFAVKVRPLLATLLTAAMVTLLLSSRGMGFVMVALVLPLVPWLVYSAYVVAAKPLARGVQAQKVAIWCVAVAVMFGAQYGWHWSARRYAQSVVSAIEDYAAKHGGYPSSLEAVGLTDKQLRSELGLSGYGLDGERPYFHYASTYGPFDQWEYHFATREWEYLPD